jgi:hypothetical protein
MAWIALFVTLASAKLRSYPMRRLVRNRVACGASTGRQR